MTESVMVHDVSVATALQKLKGSGIELALYDFGTGCSKLAYLNTSR
jgi:EAL domain-containing protein (putative c-di-GMP-specific phosphodiesterase class I)